MVCLILKYRKASIVPCSTWNSFYFIVPTGFVVEVDSIGNLNSSSCVHYENMDIIYYTTILASVGIGSIMLYRVTALSLFQVFKYG